MRHEQALSLATADENAPKTVDFSGHWENQYTSTMDLVVEGKNVRGEYETASSIGGGRQRGELKGYVAGDLISFLVLWRGGSMTAWVGQMVDDDTTNPKIKTLWHLVTEIPDPQEPLKFWQAVWAGADEFHR